MEKAYFEAKGWIRFSEEDIYAEGCQPDSGGMFSGDQVFKADTIEGILDQILAFTGGDKDALELNACGEAGRVDVSILENWESYPVTEREIERWKAGEVKLWNSIYSFNVQFVRNKAEAVDFDLVEA